MDSNDKLLHYISHLVNDCPDSVPDRRLAAFALGVLEAGSDVTMNYDDETDDIVRAYERGRRVGQHHLRYSWRDAADILDELDPTYLDEKE